MTLSYLVQDLPSFSEVSLGLQSLLGSCSQAGLPFPFTNDPLPVYHSALTSSRYLVFMLYTPDCSEAHTVIFGTQYEIPFVI